MRTDDKRKRGKRGIDDLLPWVKEGVEVEDVRTLHPHGSRELESKAAQNYF